jgi:AcrR family transcriptional regulator
VFDEDRPVQAASNRRVHSKSIAKRQRILDATARALAEHGYADAKLSDIAQEAGTHAGSLYYYFASREDLIKEVMLTCLDRMCEFAESLEDESSTLSPLERVLAFVKALIDQQTSTPDDYYLRAYLRHGDHVPEGLRELIQMRRRKMRHILTRLIRCAQDAGQIPAHIDATVAAQFITGATNWMCLWYERTGPIPAEEVIETFTELMLHGLRGRPEPAPASSRPRARKRG